MAEASDKISEPDSLNLSYEDSIRPLLKKHCVACHGEGDEIHGDVNFFEMTADRVDKEFELWDRVVELVLDDSMPPDDQPRLSKEEKDRLSAWHQERFVDSIEAHPGFFRPRRLSANEYRNSLRSLFGFDLEVAVVEAEQTVSEKSLVLKLLPTDPPGPSGFENDTSANPLTTTVLDQYAYLVDVATRQLFRPRRRKQLETLVGPVTDDSLSPEQAMTLLQTMTSRAFRRHIAMSDLEQSLRAIDGKTGPKLVAALQSELKAILLSPPFIYRGLLIDVPRDRVDRVDAYEQAERLSYFLWSDMPDETLLNLAADGSLQSPEVYRAQVDRMLASPRSRSLASDFARQWFSLDEIDKANNNPPVANALKQQPLDFVDYLFRERRPIVELIDSRVTFVNHLTSKFYPKDRKQLSKYRKQKGIEIEQLPNQKIRLDSTAERGGILTMPGILAMNRGPVLRGTWMLERILGEHLPDPPADVGQVAANLPGQQLTFRERFELHRSNPTCAVCHDKIDPLGFAMQRYDDRGSFIQDPQTTGKKGNQTASKTPSPPVDTSGKLPSGEAFDDYQGLKTILVTSQRERVTRNVVRRTLAYALCRKLEAADGPAVDEIVAQLIDENGTFHDLIHLVAASLPFTHTEYRSAGNVPARHSEPESPHVVEN